MPQSNYQQNLLFTILLGLKQRDEYQKKEREFDLTKRETESQIAERESRRTIAEAGEERTKKLFQYGKRVAAAGATSAEQQIEHAEAAEVRAGQLFTHQLSQAESAAGVAKVDAEKAALILPHLPTIIQNEIDAQTTAVEQAKIAKDTSQIALDVAVATKKFNIREAWTRWRAADETLNTMIATKNRYAKETRRLTKTWEREDLEWETRKKQLTTDEAKAELERLQAVAKQGRVKEVLDLELRMLRAQTYGAEAEAQAKQQALMTELTPQALDEIEKQVDNFLQAFKLNERLLTQLQSDPDSLTNPVKRAAIIGDLLISTRSGIEGISHYGLAAQRIYLNRILSLLGQIGISIRDNELPADMRAILGQLSTGIPTPPGAGKPSPTSKLRPPEAQMPIFEQIGGFLREVPQTIEEAPQNIEQAYVQTRKELSRIFRSPQKALEKFVPGVGRGLRGEFTLPAPVIQIKTPAQRAEDELRAIMTTSNQTSTVREEKVQEWLNKHQPPRGKVDKKLLHSIVDKVVRELNLGR